MKKFLNILLLLGTLGLVVACKPAGKDNAKLKRLKQKEESVEPPIWDGDPEEILAEEDFAWFAAVNSIFETRAHFMGFYQNPEDGQLYVYFDSTTNQAYYPKNAKDTWANILQSGVRDVDTAKNGWYTVIWDKNDKYTFTIPSINEKYATYEFKLDTTDKALKVYDNGKRETDFYKCSLDPKVPFTPNVQALKPNDNIIWCASTGNPDRGSKYYTFWYDESTQRLYYYVASHRDNVLDALVKKDFSTDNGWQLVYPSPYDGEENVFYTMRDWPWNNANNLQFALGPNGTLLCLPFDHREDGEYYLLTGDKAQLVLTFYNR